MARPWKRGRLIAGIALLGLAAMQGSTAQADVTMDVTATIASSIVETVASDLRFGTIDLDPVGDTITINSTGAANTGGAAATPVAGGSTVITGGGSGQITITSAAGVDFSIDVGYPGDGTVHVVGPTSATDITLDSIEANSGDGADGAIAHTGGAPTDIYIGGVLVFPNDAEPGAYTGSMTITLDYL